MKSIQYLDILKRAFIVTWKNKFLWVFGLIIFLGSLASNINIDNESIVTQLRKDDVIDGFISSNPALFFSFGLVLIAIAIGLFLLKFVAIAATIKSVNNIELYRQLGFRKIFIEAKGFLWKLLALEIVVGLLLVVIIVALAVPVVYLFSLGANILAILLLVAAVVILLPLVILATYMRKYAYFFVVLLDGGIKTSLESAYAVFKKNIASSLIMGAITIGTSVALFASVASLLMILAVALSPFGIAAYWLFAKTGALIVFLIGGVSAVALLLVIFSWYAVFINAAWLYFFQQISFKKIKDEEASEKVKVEGEVPTPEAV